MKINYSIIKILLKKLQLALERWNVCEICKNVFYCMMLHAFILKYLLTL